MAHVHEGAEDQGAEAFGKRADAVHGPERLALLGGGHAPVGSYWWGGGANVYEKTKALFHVCSFKKKKKRRRTKPRRPMGGVMMYVCVGEKRKKKAHRETREETEG